MKKRRFTVVMSEEELVFRLKSRDAGAFEALYDNYAPALYGVILKIVRTDPPASDVVQELFLKVWNQIESYNASKGTLFTWLLNIGRNLAIDKIRSATFKRAQQTIEATSDLQAVDHKHQTTSEVDFIGLKEYINTMKPEHRQLIDMMYFQGFTQAEVSKQLQIPLGTIKSRIRQALQHLKDIFDKEFK